MRLRNNPKAINDCLKSNYFIDITKINDKNIIDCFKNKLNKTYLEIGSGKGKFLFESATRNPNINYLGIEKFVTIIAKAINNYEKQEKKVENLLLAWIDADKLDRFFNKNIDKIILNFSDPWPKTRHAKRRLVHINYLKKYKKILRKNGIIEFKTDNENLFKFCLEQITAYKNIHVIDKTYDLYSLDDSNKLKKYNIQTEYEKKFLQKKIKIKKIIFTFK